MTKSIMLVGVGGQGTLLASRILGNVFLKNGFDVKVSEVHGMSQRGGSVVTYVRYGDKVNSPVIDKGEADIIISFEQMEAARWTSYLKKDGKLITNLQKLDPMPVITGAASYNENIIEKLKTLDIDVTAIDALELAQKAGSAKAVNVVLMGVLSKILDFPEDCWQTVLVECVPVKAVEINRKAFLLGREADAV